MKKDAEYYASDDPGYGVDMNIDAMPPSNPYTAGSQPYPGSPPPLAMPLNDPTIAHMRWVPDELTHMMYKRLSGVNISVIDGVPQYTPIPGVRPKMNHEGVEWILTSIEGVINQFVGLSNISDEEANELIAQYLYGVAGDLVYNQQRFGINSGDLRLVMNVVKALVFSQVKRAVKGHESRNFSTQHIEQNTQQHFSQGQQNQGFFLNPFRKKGG